MKKLLALSILLVSVSSFADLAMPVKCLSTMPDGDEVVLIVKRNNEQPARMFDLEVFKANGRQELEVTCIAKEQIECDSEQGIKLKINVKEGESKSSLTINSGPQNKMTCY